MGILLSAVSSLRSEWPPIAACERLIVCPRQNSVAVLTTAGEAALDWWDSVPTPRRASFRMRVLGPCGTFADRQGETELERAAQELDSALRSQTSTVATASTHLGEGLGPGHYPDA